MVVDVIVSLANEVSITLIVYDGNWNCSRKIYDFLFVFQTKSIDLAILAVKIILFQ